jgi:hypothetical protein
MGMPIPRLCHRVLAPRGSGTPRVVEANVSKLVKISWDADRREAQSWMRDRHGWFRMGRGFDVGGYRVEIVSGVPA